MVSGHKVTTLWPMASPMTLSFDAYYGFCLSFLQWNSRFVWYWEPVLVCWFLYPFCLALWPIVNNNHLSPTRWQFLFGSWVWMSLSLLLPTLTLGAGSCWLLLSTPCCSVCSCVVTELPLLFFMPSFALCWAQWSGSQLYALFSFVPDSYWSLFLRLVSCWNETWICCVLRTKELCITSLFDFWPPQSPDVFPLVYDDDFLWQSSSETTSLHPSWYITVKLL